MSQHDDGLYNPDDDVLILCPYCHSNNIDTVDADGVDLLVCQDCGGIVDGDDDE